MKLLKQILWPTDLQSTIEDEFKIVLLLARTFSSEVVLLHVVPFERDTELYRDIVHTEVAARLARLRNLHVTDGGYFIDLVQYVKEARGGSERGQRQARPVTGLGTWTKSDAVIGRSIGLVKTAFDMPEEL